MPLIKPKVELPTDLDQDPDAYELNFSELPIMYINLFGNYPINELKAYGEYLQDEIEKMPEISYVDLQGALEREIRIDADLFKMQALGVSFRDIEQAIASENVTISGGNLRSGDFRRSIRVIGEFENMEEIRKVVVKNEGDRLIYLREVADVRDTYEEPESYARADSLPVVTLNVVKRSGQNILNASAKIKTILDKAQASELPNDLQVSITNDQSKQIQFMVSNLENSIISGVILVMAVLFFFMGWRSAVFVGVAIPLSMFISFITLNAFGVTLNMMVLFSLILALGMLVDNGIVVIENIYRLLEEGYSIMDAVKQGVGEIAWPIIASTSTTVAAFLPLAFWGGLMGDFMKFLPITLIVVLSASLFVGLVINPVLALIFARLENNESKLTQRNLLTVLGMFLLSLPLYLTGSMTLANLLALSAILMLCNILFLGKAAQWFQQHFLVMLENFYSRVINFSLKGARPYALLSLTVLLLIFSFYLIGNSGLKVDFFPDSDPLYINVFIQKPIGTDIEETNRFTKKIENRVIEMMEPYDYMIDAIIAQVGKGTNDPMAGPSPGVTPHRARITVSFKEFEFRYGQSTADILELVREEVKNYPGAQITVGRDPGWPSRWPSYQY